ncbi:hypothetical protein [Candidatus Methylacidithermus pantelleriae]|uniref:hypothetical protein n=1 Tax=Candidatus Methylacidithermus pantelleriae TaxID=2744239 RepID=UPI001BD2AA81|nr:hypothetical protein [Candidatus Methylacidithermus pantelleriae]
MFWGLLPEKEEPDGSEERQEEALGLDTRIDKGKVHLKKLPEGLFPEVDSTLTVIVFDRSPFRNGN